MLQDEKHTGPVHQGGSNLNCPLVDNRCEHCGVSVFQQNPDILADELRASEQRQGREQGAMQAPPPPYQVSGGATPRARSTVEATPTTRAQEADAQPPEGRPSPRRLRRRPRRTLRFRITINFSLGDGPRREKAVTFI